MLIPKNWLNVSKFLEHSSNYFCKLQLDAVYLGKIGCAQEFAGEEKPLLWCLKNVFEICEN